MNGAMGMLTLLLMGFEQKQRSCKLLPTNKGDHMRQLEPNSHNVQSKLKVPHVALACMHQLCIMQMLLQPFTDVKAGKGGICFMSTLIITHSLSRT